MKTRLLIIIVFAILVVGFTFLTYHQYTHYKTWGNNEMWYYHSDGYTVECEVRLYQNPGECKAIDENGNIVDAKTTLGNWMSNKWIGGGESESGINCNDKDDKFLCFGNAFDSCTLAVFTHIMITDDGYPITVEAYVTDECKIHVTNDNRENLNSRPIHRELLEGQCNELQLKDDFMDIKQCVFGENLDGSVKVWHNKE